MKFAQQLRQGAVEEWRRAYVDYRLLKKLIKAAAASQSDTFDNDGESSQPLNLPASPPTEGVSSPAEELRTSSDDEAPPPRENTRGTLPAAQPSAQRITRIESRSSTRSQLQNQASFPGGLRLRRKASKPGSVRDTRWRYPPDLTLEELLPKLNPQERKFFQTLDNELEKVETFYEERESEALRRFKVLQEQLDQLASHRAEYLARHSKKSRFVHPIVHQAPHRVKNTIMPATSDGNESPRESRAEGSNSNSFRFSLNSKHSTPQIGSHLQFNPESYIAARRKLKLAVFEFYKYLGYVKNYRLLNRTGFSKSTKKMEKVTRIRCQEAYMVKVHKSHFSSSNVIDDLQSQTESMFGASFEKGSRKKAVQRLRFMGASKSHHFASWRAGIMLGAAIPALVDGLVRVCQEDTQRRIPAWPAMLQLYGSFLLPVLLAFGVGLNLIGWSRAHINIPLVFYFDTRNAIDLRQYLEIPSALLFTLCYCFWLSMTVASNTVSAQVWPLVWLITTILILFNPLPIFHRTARWWLIKSTIRVFFAGLVRVQFRDFWLGDQFASLYYTSYNLGLLVCAYSHHWAPDVPSVCSTNETWASPVLASLPFLWRFGQSLRRYYDSQEVKTHLVNAGKYSMGVLYLFMYFNYRIHGSQDGSARFAMFIVFAIINSSYSLVWDYLMDWNIFKRNPKHRFLRDEIAFKNQLWFYYFAIVTNFILRFSWILYLIPGLDLRLKGFLISLLETIRRWQWNFIRVESEHVGNIDGFRVTRDVPLPYTIPSHSNNTLPAVLDEENDEEGDVVMPHTSDNFRQEKSTSSDPEAMPMSARTSSFATLLPGEVARRFKAAIFGTPGGPTYPDESDDKEDSGDNNNGKAVQAGDREDSSNNEQEDAAAAEEGADSDAAVQAKKGKFPPDTPKRNDTIRSYNTFGWDSDVENVRSAQDIRTLP